MELIVATVSASSRSAKAHRKLVRQRQGVKYDAGRARAIAAVAIRKAARAKNNPTPC